MPNETEETVVTVCEIDEKISIDWPDSLDPDEVYALLLGALMVMYEQKNSVSREVH